MGFPEVPRVVYERNPLAMVVCQLRFPPILRIETELPARFQERIRGDYPSFNERRNPGIPLTGVPPEIAKQITDELVAALGNAANRHYEFGSVDGVWKVSLGRDSVALTTQKYERWTAFRDRLGRLVEALHGEYAPPFYTRIGLRYRDIIKKHDFGLDDAPWSELLTPHIAGELSSSVAPAVERIVNDVTIRLETGHVRLRHGLVPVGDKADPNVYVIDSDFFIQDRTEIDNAFERLDFFSRESYRLFRWAIQERLHNAMAPRAI